MDKPISFAISGTIAFPSDLILFARSLSNSEDMPLGTPQSLD
jgi:hypothetical protein